MARPAKNLKVEQECRACHQIKTHTTVNTTERNGQVRVTVPGPCIDCETAKRKARRDERIQREPDYREKINAASRQWRRSPQGQDYINDRKGTESQREIQRRYDESEKGKARSAIAQERAFVSGKEQARAAVRCAIRAGILIRPLICQECRCDHGVGVDGRCLVEAHHPHGYSPEFHLSVRWLCRACHAKAEAEQS